MRDTPPRRPRIADRPDPELIEDLCLALRDLGVRNACLPDWDVAREAIAKVKELADEVRRRELRVTHRLERLSEETGWPMADLLDDAIRYPDSMPYLPHTPGPRCGECGEPISRAAVLGLCDACLERGIAQLQAGTARSHLDRCSLCSRAAPSAFLVYAAGEQWINYCSSCLAQEQSRRAPDT